MEQSDLRLMGKLASEIIAADALGRNFQFEQTIGKWLSLVLSEAFNATVFEGFSHYSAEKCHEDRHGEGTCPYFKARDYSCEGRNFNLSFHILAS